MRLSLAGGIDILHSYELLIPNGTIVRLEGLGQRPEYNGKYGKISGWTERAEQYTGYDISYYEVQFSLTASVRVKMGNVIL